MTQKLQEIFTQFLENKPIFAQRAALTISFTPETIPHREKQIADLGRILAPALRGGKPSNVFIYGRTGTGKSLVSLFVCSELKKAAKGNDIKPIYINCKMKKVADTEYRLLAGLLKELGEDVPFTGLPTDQLYQTLFKKVDEKEQVVLLIIDEIDALVAKTGDEILYNLTRANSELKKAKLALIGITNDLGFIERLDPRIKSSLSEEELLFPPYNAVQLQDILRQRASLAFVPGVLEDGVIEKAAALAAQEHGDARRALDLLRVAGELAERAAEAKVTIKHVDAAQDKIDQDRVLEIVKSQARQSQAVLWAIIQATEGKKAVESGHVFDAYNKICIAHGLKPLTQRRVSDLIAELDLFGIINTKVISRGRGGRTRLISTNLSSLTLTKLKNTLMEIFI
ncbi:MAG: orc1/cdc6 family replication initiation protein [Candidatus Aenigmatarchaeota archaeon]|nr:orc1/cdc6 family replication initiation protein [Candidatus Aenigmarchaeota archaeon]